MYYGYNYGYYPRFGIYSPPIVQTIVPQPPPQIQNQITIKLNKYDFYKGEYVEGEVLLQANTSMILNDIDLNLNLVENWNTQVGSTPMNENNNSLLLNIKIGIGKILKINSNVINLSPGAYKFPFKFQLPDYLQPCFEHPKDNQRCYLRYVLEAKLISAYTQGVGKIYLFIKARPLILNCPLSYTTEADVHKWGILEQGVTILKASYKTSNYQMRGQIPITVQIDNTRGKLSIKSINVKVIRKVQFKRINEGLVKFTFDDIMLKKDFATYVPPNTNSQAYNYIIDLKEENASIYNYYGISPPYPTLKDITFSMPTTDSAAIKCDYFLEITVTFNSFVTKEYKPKIIIPFTLTHQLQEDYDLEQKENDDLKKAIEASLLDAKYVKLTNTNINEIDSYKNKEEQLDDYQGENNQINENNNNIYQANQINNNNNIYEDNHINDNNNNIYEVNRINENNINIYEDNQINDNNIKNNNQEIPNYNDINNNEITSYQENINDNNNPFNNENNNPYNNENNPFNNENNNFNNENNPYNNENNPFNNQEVINCINNNINENKNINEINNEMNEQNNNNKYIKFDDEEDMVNPYELDIENNSNNDKKSKNFSINDNE